jgi:hypothetical protein
VVRTFWTTLLLSTALLSSSCEVVKGIVDDPLAQCTDVCTKIQECDASPPTPEFGSLGAASSGQGGIDCAVGCAADDRELRGYSDCQIQCLVDTDCGQLSDCWKPKSELYATFCLADRDVPDISPTPDDPPSSNGSQTGNDEADVIVEDPSVAIAVDEAEDGGFVVNYGDDPPRLVGKFQVEGQIDEASNARPVGSPIVTAICFYDYNGDAPGGVEVSYCEDGVPGTDTAPLTGTNDAFTAYFEYPGQATVLFSGSLKEDGTASQVEALVVYTFTTDAWELSHTNWQPDGDCDSCN